MLTTSVILFSIVKDRSLSNGEDFDRLDVESTDLPLHPQTVGP